MTTPRPDRVFRLAGVITAVWINVPSTLGLALQGPAGLLRESYEKVEAEVALAYFAVMMAIQIGSTAVFAFAFWLATGEPRPGARPWVRIATLSLQTFIAVAGNAGHLILLAAELPLALPPRLARRWLAAQLCLFVLAAVLVVAAGLLPAPDRGEVVLVLGTFVGWQAVAFVIGSLAARERRLRRDLGRANADLVATRQLLAEGSRLAERTRLARELHDSLGHGLAALGVSLDLAARTTQGLALETVRAVHAEARDLYREVREVVKGLRAEPGFEVGRALRTLLGGASSAHLQIDIPDDLAIEEPASAHALFVCVRQAVRDFVPARGDPAPGDLRLAVRREPGGLRLTLGGRGTSVGRHAGALERLRRTAAEVGARVEPGAEEGGWTLCFPAPAAGTSP